MAKIQDFRIGQKVRDIQTGWEMIVTTVGVLNMDLDSPYIYCDFEGNEGDVFEYEPDELEIIDTESKEQLQKIKEVYYNAGYEKGKKKGATEQRAIDIKALSKVYADLLSAKGYDIGTINSELARLQKEIKEE